MIAVASVEEEGEGGVLIVLVVMAIAAPHHMMSSFSPLDSCNSRTGIGKIGGGDGVSGLAAGSSIPSSTSFIAIMVMV